MASPFLASWEDTQKDLVEPALNGTSTVLESVAKTGDTVKRVVLTSSFAGELCAFLNYVWGRCLLAVIVRLGCMVLTYV